MYGLPVNFDGAFFVGRCPDFVLFSANTVSVTFDTNFLADPSLSILITGAFEHRLGPSLAPAQQAPDDPLMLMRRIGRGLVPGSSEIGVQEPPVDSSMLMRIIGHAVMKVEIMRPGTLELHFDDGQLLVVFEDAPNYECYTISYGKDDIYV